MAAATSNDSTGPEKRAKIVKFRNYTPKTEELQQNKLPNTKPESIESHVQEQLQLGKDSDTVKDVNLLNPKKTDWDLKRDISKKLEKLERRTQKAIIEIIRERLQTDSSGLASAVATVEQQPTSSSIESSTD